MVAETPPNQHREELEAANHLITNALMDMEAGDVGVARDEILEAQRIVYGLLR